MTAPRKAPTVPAPPQHRAALAARVAELSAARQQADDGEPEPETIDFSDGSAYSVSPDTTLTGQAQSEDLGSAASAVVRAEVRKPGDDAEFAELRSGFTQDVELAKPEHVSVPMPAAGALDALALAHAELERLREQLRLARDESDAARRHNERARAELSQTITADVIAKILPVLDDVERAVAHVPEELREHHWARGVAMIGTSIQVLLDRTGLERIAPSDELFDPRYHEAISLVTDNAVADHTVTQLYRTGYILNGRVLRPAQVEVTVPLNE